MKKRTLLIGNFGDHNVGDELILSLALEAYPNALVMTSNALASQTFCERTFPTVPFFPVGLRSFGRFIFSKKYRQSVKDLQKQVDQIVFPGGGLFAIRFKAYLLWFGVLFWCRLLLKRVPIVFEHQGIDTRIDFGKKMLLSWVFSGARKISTRNRASADLMRDICHRNIISEADRVRSWSVPFATEGPRLLLNAIRPCEAEYESLRKEFPHHTFVFIAFAPADLACVPEAFEGQVVFPRTQSEVKNIFSCFERAIGERLHFLICAQVFSKDQKVYSLRKPYSEKVDRFMDEEGITVF